MKFRCCGTGSTGNCYSLISSSGEILLVECGVKRWNHILKMIDYKVSDVSGCILTHQHFDHCYNMKNVLDAGIQIYTNDKTVKNMNIRTSELMKGVPERYPFRVGSFIVTPFELPHTTYDKEAKMLIPCPNFGYLVEHEEMGKLLYLTDFEYCRYKFKSMEINHLVIGCNYCEELIDRNNPKWEHQITGHCSLSTCKQFIKKKLTESLKTVTLVHLSSDASDAGKMFKEIKEVVGDDVLVQIGRAGLEVDLNLCPF